MTAKSFCRYAGLICGVWLLMAAAGCQMDRAAGSPANGRMPTTQEAIEGTESGILDVVAYYSTPVRWMWTENRTRIHGLIVSALYLMGPNGKGVFGDGIIHPRLYVRDRSISDLDQQWQLVKEWKFTPQDMMIMRSKRPNVQGNGYMLPLNWDDLDLSGREIRVVVGYIRTDGGPSPRASVKDLLVPAKGT